MPRCPHCTHEFAISEGFKCPSCGEDYRSAGSSKPAHLAVLEGDAAPEAKPRLVSSAGPSVPVRARQNDSVPNGWMARLEAARVTASNAPQPTSGAPAPAPAAPVKKPPPPAAPPPLRKPKKNGLEGKPAHLLVAQLEQEETKRRAAEAERIQELFTTESTDEISSVQVEVPVEARTKKKKIPDWLIGLVVVAVVAVGGLVAYNTVEDAPEPTVTVDPELAAAVEKRREAMAELEEGHVQVLQGEKGAKKAIEHYQRALKLEPTLAKAERGLASAHAALHDKATAVEHYRRYLEMEPDAKDAAEVREIIDQYEKRNK
ncbi:MAG: tetratricopeptide repeat protein [Deltaproteobacteria bacterium]